MTRALRAGAVYFALVFAFAFVTGVIRTLFVAPRVGEVVAVLLEVPLILAVSWSACQWTMRRLAVSPQFTDRLVMGGAAFALLMGAELGLSVFAFGRPAGIWLASLQTPAGMIGLAAQAAFGLMPLITSRGRLL